MQVHALVWPGDRIDHIARHGVRPEEVEEVCFGPALFCGQNRTEEMMEKTLKKPRLPASDSIDEMAKFWDVHDLTDFEADLEELRDPIFARLRGGSLNISLKPPEARQLKAIARSMGIDEADVLRRWILEKLREDAEPMRRKTRRGD